MTELALIPIPEKGRNDRQLDVVFVHGLGDNDVDAWQQQGDPATFWPNWLADEYPNIKIWILRYGAPKFWFDSGSQMGLPSSALSVLHFLADNHLGERNLLFVTHSLGGLVVKLLLRTSEICGDERLKVIAKSTRGVVFLATPHSGSSIATVALRIGIASKLAAELQGNNEWLADLDTWYRNNVAALGWKTRAFYETKALKPGTPLVVDQSSADPKIANVIAAPAGADHKSICKPDSKAAPVYKGVATLIAECLTIVQARNGTVSADPRPPAYAAQLPPPGSPMEIDNPWYIPRTTDQTALALAEQIGRTMTIKGPRQIGKSSLLSRVITTAQRADKRPVLLDFWLLDRTTRESSSRCYRHLAMAVCEDLGLPIDVDDFWNDGLSDSHNCTKYFGERILPRMQQPVMLALDHADVLFQSSFCSDFFGMLRVWHNSRTSVLTKVWKRLDIAMVVSNEPKYFIDRIDQSPFNVGEILRLGDFSPEQVRELNKRHYSPLSEAEVLQLISLLGGHPYLIQRALYSVTQGCPSLSASELFATSLGENSPFAEHLESIVKTLYGSPTLIPTFLDVFVNNRESNDQLNIDRLAAIGLVKREAGKVRPRCKLYADYLKPYADDLRRSIS